MRKFVPPSQHNKKLRHGGLSGSRKVVVPLPVVLCL